MPTLKLAFHIHLDGHQLPSMLQPKGPLFSRYVPDGKSDAVVLTIEGDPHVIRVWFERRAVNDGDFLKWTHNGDQFDPTIMRRQAKLDAGPLFGDLLMPDVSDAEMTALLRNPKAVGETFGQGVIEDPAYIGFAKRVIEHVQPPVSRFLSTLRNQFGQHWLFELRRWDSRTMTLGNYCAGAFGLRWWHEQRQVWCHLLPTDMGATITAKRAPGREYEEYLTEVDWARLKASRCLKDVATEVQLLGNSSRSLDAGDYRQAFVEAISALEVAVGNRLTSQNNVIKGAIQSFQDRETQRAQIAVVMLALGEAEEAIENALDALRLRNKVVHEGYRPTSDDTNTLRKVLRTIGKISGIDEIKSPVLTNSNLLGPPSRKA
jgi:hypothetical protein